MTFGIFFWLKNNEIKDFYDTTFDSNSLNLSGSGSSMYVFV